MGKKKLNIKNIKNIIVYVIGIILFLTFIYFKVVDSKKTVDLGEKSESQFQTVKFEKNPIAYIYIANCGTLKVELYPNEAEETVKNFIQLVLSGYYDGKEFNIIDSSKIEGGNYFQGEEVNPTIYDLNGDNNFDHYGIKGEFKENGIENPIATNKGTLYMLRDDNNYNSASGGFGILLEDDSSLKGQYAAFGKIIGGFEVLQYIQKLKSEDESLEKLSIEKITLDLKDQIYGFPEVFEDKE